MYIEFFGMAQYPFSLTPNTRFFLKLPSHEQAFGSLLATLDARSGFSKIVGEVGTGKTMLCRKFLNSLEAHKQRYITAFIPHPILSEDAVMHTLAEELGIERTSDISYYELLKLITEAIIGFCNEDKIVVLFIDEAQAMPEESLEAIHLLRNAKTEDGRHLQVVLFGQPELDRLLKQPALKKLNENISFSFELPALSEGNTVAYVRHRLLKSGYNGPALFSRNALELLYRGSAGIPRLINILTHKALMVAFGKGKLLVSENHIQAAIEDTDTAHR